MTQAGVFSFGDLMCENLHAGRDGTVRTLQFYFCQELFHLARIRLVFESGGCPAHYSIENRSFLVVLRAWPKASPDGELVLEAHLLLKPVEGTLRAGCRAVISVYAGNEVLGGVVEYAWGRTPLYETHFA